MIINLLPILNFLTDILKDILKFKIEGEAPSRIFINLTGEKNGECIQISERREIPSI